MEAKVTLCGGMRFVGQADSGHAVVMDTTAANGGLDSAVRPNELLLIGLAGCTGMDVISILRKKRQPVTGLEVVVRAEMAPAPPKRMIAIGVEYRVRGTGVDPAAVRRAIELSETAYCSVGLTLKQSVPIATSFTITADEAEEADDAPAQAPGS
jgi:putative redox protein